MQEPADASTARQLIVWGAEQFERAGLHYGHGTDNPLDEAVQLVFFAAGIEYGAEEAELDRPLAAAARSRALELLRRRIAERKPAPYLTGIAWYGGLKFRVDERVLIPRSSILELIEQGFAPWIGDREPWRILDLCTGSGCLAIHCALAFPAAHVDASDVSYPALTVAASNLQRHGLEDRVRLLHADVFDGLPEARYDLIISNPPYVSGEEMTTLPEEYRHEPVLGLEAEDGGLAIVARILADAPAFLAPEGLLVVEVGNSETAVMQRWPELPLIWPEFERSEGGVFIIGAQELRAWHAARG